MILGPPVKLILKVVPANNGLTTCPSVNELDKTFPLTTWYKSTFATVAESRSSKLDLPKSLSNEVNAAFVGAKTVNGPGPDKAPTKLALTTACTKILKSGFPWANSTMFFLGVVSLGSSFLQPVNTDATAEMPKWLI